MKENDPPVHKPATTHLHMMNLFVATVAGLVSIVAGLYSIRGQLFPEAVHYGSLQGTVRDQALGRELWLVKVEIADKDGTLVDTVNTDKEGRYAVEKLKEGSYTVRAEAPRHEPETKRVKIEKDHESRINFDLDPTTPSEENADAPEIKLEEIPVSAPVMPLPNPPAVISPYAVNYAPAAAYQKVPDVPVNLPPADFLKQTNYPAPQVPELPPRNFKRFPRHYSGEGYASYAPQAEVAQPNMGQLLTQVGAQLLQNYAAKKSDSTGAGTDAEIAGSGTSTE